jgi:G3E family GTPase
LYETQQALQLDSVICLVDPQDAHRILDKRPPIEWSQIQSADALLLSKPDEDSAFRRDSRIEIVLSAAPTNDYLDMWRGLLRDVVNPPRPPFESRPPAP